MPEVHFTVRWPDGIEERCYSPSSTISDYFEAGASYPLDDFLTRARTGLNRASDRVAERYGFACSSARDQLARIEAQAERFTNRDDAAVALIRIDQGGMR